MDDFATSNRDLVARVAALELLVADLVHVLWQVSPTAMNKLANDAAHDLEIGHTRIALPVGDHQRDRLYAVLRSRQRMLKRKAAVEP
ncbi:hypothetical protein [uncultured Phenylobacterium sp.]|uniref:hypothetical protein n=1 Tax=uncultured Phenylobacterium sp. TaxID=349273 RepID=UPI0025F144D4|nr:hypothetical protein [uncultured Phenylobacterium sp.]